jgi:RNA polymerase sigma-70 factor (ECF subfamily)
LAGKGLRVTMLPTWNRDDPKALDGAVRARLDAGDLRGAVGLLVEHLGPSIHAYLRTLLLEDEAAEAYSDFQENVMKGLPGFRWDCPVRAWAHRVAFHSAARIWRRPGRRLEEPLPSALSRLGAGSGPVEPIMSSRHAGLAQLRASLSVEDQTLLTLRIDRELEWEEIAAVLDLEAPALRKRFERLVKRLREEAREHGLID